jgi:hypothetical protein
LAQQNKRNILTIAEDDDAETGSDDRPERRTLAKAKSCLVTDCPTITAKKRHATTSTSHAKGRCGSGNVDVDNPNDGIHLTGMLFLDMGLCVLIIVAMLQINGNLVR